jgi:hypothetical protein
MEAPSNDISAKQTVFWAGTMIGLALGLIAIILFLFWSLNTILLLVILGLIWAITFIVLGMKVSEQLGTIKAGTAVSALAAITGGLAMFAIVFITLGIPLLLTITNPQPSLLYGNASLEALKIFGLSIILWIVAIVFGGILGNVGGRIGYQRAKNKQQMLATVEAIEQAQMSEQNTNGGQTETTTEQQEGTDTTPPQASPAADASATYAASNSDASQQTVEQLEF